MDGRLLAAAWICYLLCTMLMLVTEKAYLDTDPTGTTTALLDMVNLPTYNSAGPSSDIAFPTLIPAFFTGVWKIIIWDFSFFKLGTPLSNALQIVKYVFFIPVTIIIVWGLMSMFASAIQSWLSR